MDWTTDDIVGTEEAGAAPNREYLTFVLGGDEYGIERRTVLEVRGYEAVNARADFQDFLKGTANLGGVIAPIVDLRIWFNVGTVHYGPLTAVIVVALNQRVVGLVVDSVCDLVTLAPSEVAPATAAETRSNSDYVVGLGTSGERALVLLDVEKLVAAAVPHVGL